MSPAEARAARLNALAHELWPDHEVMRFETTEGGVIYKYIQPSPWGSIMSHPRALDGIEALLLTLADEARIPLTADQVTRDALESCKRDREALTKRFREEQAKVAILDGAFREASAEAGRAEARLKAMEKLAEEWEAKASDCERFRVENPPHNRTTGLIAGAVLSIGDAFTACARELRARIGKP